jgi:hypothetical protein
MSGPKEIMFTCSGSYFPESSLILSDILLYHGLMHDNTYNLLVEEDILLHNVPVVDNCDIPLVLYLVQKPLFLVLHLCSLLDLLSMCCTEAPNCTAQYCTEVEQYYVVVSWYYTVAA